MEIKNQTIRMFKVFSCIILIATFLSGPGLVTVKAQINELQEEEMTAQTAYVDMSSVGPLQLYFIEESQEQKADYYYAAKAYEILQERMQIDSMYASCREVIVTVNQAFAADEVMRTNYEPQVKTGYLNLLSKDMNKCYTIDQVIIHIQRE